jgi:alginate O-acetyltransferase complex protein AlgI
MAVGLGRMCGFELPENFNYPYIARSIREFWTRWHISLAHWLRDYLFLPIAYSLSRRIKRDRFFGLKAESWAYSGSAFVTFFLCGLWHGANWTFVVWGAFYGVMLVIEHIGLRKWLKRGWKPLQFFYCQILVVTAWVFFRSPNLGYALGYLKAMMGFGSGDHSHFYPGLYLNTEIVVVTLIGMIGVFPVVPFLKRVLDGKRLRLSTGTKKTAAVVWNISADILVFLFSVAVLTACTLTLVSGTYRPFIYFRF